MRPEIKRMNERLGYFLHELDLCNAHINHAEEEIDRLNRELAVVRESNDILREALKKSEEENSFLTQTLNTENDRLDQNEELEKENAKLRLKNNALENDMADLAFRLKWAITENKDLNFKIEEMNKLKLGHYYCKCGAIAIYHRMINGGEYYCVNCFKRDVVKL